MNYYSYFIQISLVFLCNILFLFQDPTQDTKLHLVIMSSLASLNCESFSEFSCFGQLFGMQYRQVFCIKSTSLDFCDVFLMIRQMLRVLWSKTTDVSCHQGGILSVENPYLF